MAPLMMIPKLLLGAASVLAALLMVGCGPEADALEEDGAAATPVPAPTNFIARTPAAGTSRGEMLNLRWTAPLPPVPCGPPTQQGPCTEDRFEIQHNTFGAWEGREFVPAHYQSGDLWHLREALAEDSLHQLRIRTLTADGPSVWVTTSARTSVNSTGYPVGPDKLSATVGSTMRLTFRDNSKTEARFAFLRQGRTWRDPADNSTYFRIGTLNAGPGVGQVLSFDDADRDLIAGESYDYIVAAEGASGLSYERPGIAVQTAAPTGPISQPQISVQSSCQVTWGLVGRNVGAYVLEHLKADGTWARRAEVPSWQTQISSLYWFRDVTLGRFRVRARNASGYSPPSRVFRRFTEEIFGFQSTRCEIL